MRLVAWTLVLGFGLAVISGAVLQAQRTSAMDKAYIGTWTLNVAKSKYVNATPPKEGTRTHDDRGDGFVIVWQDQVNAQGVRSRSGYTYKPDGKEYPMAQLNATVLQTISLTSVDPYTVEFSFHRDGKVTSTGRRVLAKDGKTMIVETRGTNAQGQPTSSSAFYEKR